MKPTASRVTSKTDDLSIETSILMRMSLNLLIDVLSGVKCPEGKNPTAAPWAFREAYVDLKWPLCGKGASRL